MLGAGRSRYVSATHIRTAGISNSNSDEYLAVDAGRYNWPEDQHSVVMVDAQNAIPRPRAWEW